MNNYFSSSFKLGILGGGQLGKMLLNETRKLDIYTSVLDPSEDAPCRISCNHFQTGDLMDFDTVYQFGKQVTVLTLEIEHVNVEALVRLEQEGICVYPSSATLKTIQDKGVQKDFYTQHKIPTAPYTRYNSLEELKKGTHSFPFVWKSCRFGYDGNGVCVVKKQEDLNSLPDTPCIAEELIPFAYELAVIVGRNSNGEIRTYPVVEMEFHPEANQVEYVICPARIDEKLAEKAQEVALQVTHALKHVGLLAVELFATQEGEIIVNEVAPRPHNSGHYSIEGAYTSQYEQHLRAILNLPLGSTKSKAPSVMVNLVGAADYSGQVYYENMDQILQMEGVTPHLYGKKETRPFRKMGHVTIIDTKLEKAREKAARVKNTLKVISHE